MYDRVFLGAALLTCCTGTSSVYGQPKPVQAFVGGNIILPCSFKIRANEDLPSVEGFQLRRSDAYKLRRKSSDKGSHNGSFENQSLLSVSTDGNLNGPVEKISGEETDLEVDSFHRPEINPTQLAPWSSTPKPGPHLPRSRPYSNPEVLSTAQLPSSPPKKRVSFESSSVTQHGPNVPNLKRRHSWVLPYPSSNRFHPSPELQEETLTSI